MIIYFIIVLILILIYSAIVLRTTLIKKNDDIKIYQSINILRNSIMINKEIIKFDSYNIEFDNDVALRIKDNQIYEYPGYMPYLTGISKAKFIYNGYSLTLSFSYRNKEYNKVIFYDKK